MKSFRNFGGVLMVLAVMALITLAVWPWPLETSESFQAHANRTFIACTVLQLGGLFVGVGIVGEFLQAILTARSENLTDGVGSARSRSSARTDRPSA